MALFKISKGNSSKLPQTYNEGYCYLTTDENIFYIDKSSNKRIALNERAYKVFLRGGSTNNYKYRRIATIKSDKGLYSFKNSILLIHGLNYDSPIGVLRIGFQTSSKGASVSLSATWLYRLNNQFKDKDSVTICEYGVSGDSV